MPDRSDHIIQKAKDLGATLAGIASVFELKKSPSHKILYKFGTKLDGTYSFYRKIDVREIYWPEKAGSVVVIAVSHPEETLELDWFDKTGKSPGNNTLIRINLELSEWIEESFGIKAHRMKYAVEDGGIYLKDAAVLAGLGCIGKNNMLITPMLGPRIRLRAMILEEELTPTGPITFDPCDKCEEYCRHACSQNSFDKSIYNSVETGMTDLPGRDGSFSRARCMMQMGSDIADSEESNVNKLIKWCRRCEFACPVGR
jgi:epoxyqueuosine reductase